MASNDCKDTDILNDSAINKFIAFTYYTDSVNELKVFMKLVQENKEENEEKNENKKDEKKKKIKNLGQDLELFKIPEWFKTRVKQKFKNCYLFFINIKNRHLINEKYQIIQKCTRKLSGDSLYFSPILAINNEFDEFFIEFRFNSNDKYKLFKKPYGAQPDSNAVKLILVLMFILLQQEKNLFESMNEFLNQHQIAAKFLCDVTALKHFLYFLIDSVENRLSIQENTKVNTNTLLSFLCCCFGLISIEMLININDNAATLSKLQVEYFIQFLASNQEIVEKSIHTNATLNKCFQDGICYIMYSCLSNKESFDCLITFAQVLVDKKNELISIEELSDRFSKCGFLLKTSMLKAKKETLTVQFENIEIEETRIKIMKFIFDLCPNLESLLLLVDTFVHDDVHLIASISMRILTTDQQDQKINVNQQFEIFEKHQELFRDLRDEFMIYFVQMCTTSKDLNEMIKKADLQKPQVYTAALSTAIKLSKTMKIEELFDIVDNFKNEKPHADVKISEVEFRNEVLNKLKLIQPTFHGLDFDNIMRGLNSAFLFPYGIDWNAFFTKTFVNKITPVQSKLFISEVLIKHLNDASNNTEKWTKVFINLVLRIEMPNFDTYIVDISNILELLVKECGESEEKKELSYKVFKKLLENFHEKKDVDGLIKLINYKSLFLNENVKFVDIYVCFIKEILINRSKSQSKNEFMNSIQRVMDNIKRDASNSILKQKLLSSIFSIADKNEDSAKSIKELLFTNPSKDHILYKILDYSNIFLDMNNTNYVAELKKNIRNFIEKTVIERNLYAQDVRDMDKLDNERLKIVSEYVKSAYSMYQVPDIRHEIAQLIRFYKETVRQITIVQKLLDFVKQVFPSYQTCYDELQRCKLSIDKITIDKIKVPDCCLQLLDLAEYYQRVEDSNSFHVVFHDTHDDEHIITQEQGTSEMHIIKPEEPDLNGEVEQLKKHFGKAQESFLGLAKDIKKKDVCLKNTFFTKYFSETSTQEQVTSEIKILNEVLEIEISPDIANFLHVSITNNYQIAAKKKVFEHLVMCFHNFKIKEGNITNLLKIYTNMVSVHEFKIVDLNNTVDKITSHLNDVLQQEHWYNIQDIIHELSNSENLIDYLISKDERDIRSMIDSFDEHGDNLIRVQNILELCKISQFIKKINKNDEMSFLKSILSTIEADSKSEAPKFRNLGAIIHTSMNLLDNIKLLLDTMQNREEASKIKILELGTNAKFEIEFSGERKKFNLKTLFRGKRELALNDLYDLRDRAMLMINNKKTAQDYMSDENNNNNMSIEDSKRVSNVFISSVELLNNIVNCMNLNYENGYPMNELYDQKCLNIIKENNDEIKDFNNEISSISCQWNDTLTEAMERSHYMCY